MGLLNRALGGLNRNISQANAVKLALKNWGSDKNCKEKIKKKLVVLDYSH